MVLYYGITTYHILCCIIHKLKFNNDKKATLLISNINVDHINLINKIELSGVFDRVEIFQDAEIMRICMLPRDDKVISEQIDRKIEDISHGVADKLPVKIKDTTEIYLCGDQYPLGIHCISNSIKYNFFEEARGVMSFPDVVLNNIKRTNLLHYFITEKLGALGRNDCVTNILADISNQIGILDESNVQDFNITDILRGLSTESLSIIKQIFNVPNISVDNSSKNVLVLTQHFVNLGTMTFSDQKKLYSLLVDYFAEDSKIFVKPHPSDIHINYQNLWEDSTQISGNFPAELIPFVIDGEFELAITASSTSIFGLKGNVRDIIYFSTDIEKTFHYMHRYYLATEIINSIKNKDYKYYSVGASVEQINQFIYFSDNKKSIDFESILNMSELFDSEGNSKLVIVDDVSKITDFNRNEFISWLEQLNNDDIVIFVNSNNNYDFYDIGYEKILENISCLNINKTKIAEHCYDDLTTEKIFIFHKNNEFYSNLDSVMHTKQLKSLGIEISVEDGSRFKNNMEYIITKGIIDTTRERLSYYGSQVSTSTTQKELLVSDAREINYPVTEWILEATETRLLEYINLHRKQ